MQYREIKRSHGKDAYIKFWLETLKEISHLGHNHDDDNNIKMDVMRHELWISEIIWTGSEYSALVGFVVMLTIFKVPSQLY
jgi:hypothetical protein